MSAYFPATRHPWPCFWFLLPLLAAYEAGVLWLGGAHPEAVRNGADSWVRAALEGAGLRHLAVAPLLVAALFLARSWWRRADRPRDLVGVTTGMALESVFFGLALWALSWALVPLLDHVAKPGSTPPAARAAGQVVTFVGAGIYEEVLFRLLLYSFLVWVLCWAALPAWLAVPLAAAGSAALFSAAHHLGPFGEPFAPPVFLFRLAAGLYFAALYHLRGFGVVVGAHALYDVLVGVALG